MANYFDQFDQQDQKKQPPADVSVTVNSPGVLGTLGDMAKGLVGGTFDAVNNTLKAPADIAEATGLLSSENAEAVRQKVAFLPEIAEQDTTLGAITRSVTRFGIGFVGAGKIVAPVKALAGASRLARAGVALAQGAVSDFLVSDPHESRLADLVQAVPALENPVTEYLASSKDDGLAEGRFKAALEGVMLGGLTDVVMHGVQGIRAARALRAAGNHDAAEKLLAESTKTVDTALQKASAEPHQLEMFQDVAEKSKLVKDATSETAKQAAATPARAIKLSPESREAFRERLRGVNKDALDDYYFDHGVINYEIAAGPTGAKMVIDDVASIFADDLKHVAGTYRSQRDSVELATMVGAKPEILDARLRLLSKHSDMFEAYLLAGKTTIQSMARDVYDLAMKLDKGLGGETGEKLLALRTEALAEMTEHVSAIQTGYARATAAGAVRTKDGLNPGEVADFLLKRLGGSDKLKEVAKRIAMSEGNPKGIIASLKDPSLAEKAVSVHNFYWMNSILSGVKTSVVNNVSNAIQTLIMPAERIMGGVVTLNPQQIREGVYQYTALHHTVFDAWEMARRSFKTDMAILDPGHGQIDNAKRALSADYLGIHNSIVARGVNALGTIVGMPGRFLNMQDEFWKQVNYRSHVMAEAMYDGKITKGLSGSDLKNFIEMRLNDTIAEAGERLGGHTLRQGQGKDKAALLYSQQATFTQSLTRETWMGQRSFGEIMSDAAAQHPLLRGTVLPFVRVPTNLMRGFMDSGPQAFLQRQFWSEIQAGGERAAMAWGKVGMGTLAWTGGAMLANSGRITGAGPQDKDLQRQLRGDGWQPYSFVFHNDDGTKSYLSYARLDPFAYFLGLAADYAQVAGKVGYEDMEKFAVNGTLAMAQNLTNKTYLRGMVDIMGMLGGGYNKEDAVRKYFEYRIASYMPSLASTVNPDAEMKELRGWMDGFIARVPGLSRSIEARRDNFGDKIMAPMGYPLNAINPFTVTSTTKSDPVREELARLASTHSEARFALPEEKVAGGRIDLTKIRNSEGQSAYDRWLQLHQEHTVGGKTLHESLGELIKGETYQRAAERMGDGSDLYRGSLAVELVKQRMEMYKKGTFQKLLKEYPELKEAASIDRLNAARTRVQGPDAATPNPLIQR